MVLLKRLPAIQIFVLATGLVATALIAALPSLAFAYRNGDLHDSIETAASAVALLVAFLLYGRLRETGSRTDLALIIGLVLIGLSNLGRSLLPAFDGEDDSVVWVSLTTRLVGAAVLAWAAFASPVPLRRPGRAAIYLVGGVLSAVVLIGAGWAFSGDLPTGIHPNLAASDRPSIVGAPGLLASQAALIALMGAAAVGFTRRARRTADELLGWIAIALTLAALARLNYFLFPSIYGDWVFSGDVARVGAYLVILVGALRQIGRYQNKATRTAVLEERNRIARELHDGLAQDLAYISVQAQRLAGRDPAGAALTAAADQAMARSRDAILALRAMDGPLDVAVASLAGALTDRAKVRLELDLEPEVDASFEVRANMLGIVGEAISNAVRHGDAQFIRVSVANGRGLRLSIADDGTGFDPRWAADRPFNPGGFGLISMSERAERLGGSLLVKSRPGGGTEVEVLVPRRRRIGQPADAF